MSDEVSRRTLLSRLWKAGVALMGVAGGWTSWDILQPPASASAAGPVRAVPATAVRDKAVVEVKAARAYLTRHNDQVVALSWKCPHLGCQVPWCESSQEFECPCHGSVFNRVGEYREGPSPRGMDRYALSVEDGVLVIDTSTVLPGPAPGTESIDEPPVGPRCVAEES